MIRRFIFRVLMLLLVIVSPVVFPVLLRLIDGRVSRRDLAEMYVRVWRALVRGFL